MNKGRTDTERLDALQALTTGYGVGWLMRNSTTGRGLRLHETSNVEGEPDIRDAIDKFLDNLNP
jgi:hypothetical protein